MKGKKTGGRQKGTPNKATGSLRQILADHWKRYQESGQFRQDLDALDPSTRSALMEKYAQYLIPKMKSVDMDMTHNVRLTIEDRLASLCGEDADDG